MPAITFLPVAAALAVVVLSNHVCLTNDFLHKTHFLLHFVSLVNAAGLRPRKGKCQ